MVIVNKSRKRLHIDEYHFSKLYYPSILILKEHFYVYDVWGAKGVGRRAVSLQATTRLFNIELPKIFSVSSLHIGYLHLCSLYGVIHHGSPLQDWLSVRSQCHHQTSRSIIHSTPFSLQTSFLQLHLPTMDHGHRAFGIKMLEELPQGAKMD